MASPLKFNDFLVNTVVAGAQDTSTVTGLTDGGYVITWQSQNEDGSGWGVYGQIYNSDGSTRGSAFGISSTTANDQGQPRVSALANGAFVVTWMSSNGLSNDIYARTFDSAGTPRAAEVRINTYTANDQWYSKVATLTDGGYVISWASQGQDGSGWGIYRQTFNADGTARGTEQRVNTTTADNQNQTDVIGLKDGGYVIAWASVVDPTKFTEVFVQAYEADGTPRGGETQVNTTVTDYQWRPMMAALDDGGYVVAWHSQAQDGDGGGIYMRAYDADGTARGAETLVNTTTVGDQQVPAIAGLKDGGWVIVWQSPDSGGTGVFGQMYNADGTVRGDQFAINNVRDGDQLVASVAALADGGFVVTWTSGDAASTGTDIYKQTYDADGNVTATLIEGTSAANTINGGTRADTMIGHAGDDVYVVDSANDKVIEASGEGTDTVQSGVTYTLTSNVENLELTGTAAINGTGNGQDNVITGNSGVNFLSGGAGNDTLDGGAGADTLKGGDGNDLIKVDNVGDLVDGGGGIDTVETSLNTYALSNSVENLVMTASTSVRATGNALANVITTGDGNDILEGGGGNDTLDGGAGVNRLVGGSGNDTYIVHASGDTVIETSLGGTDTVKLVGALDFKLGDWVENLDASAGADPQYLQGNALANKITGGSGDDYIDGGAGADSMVGGAGNDVYVVDNAGDKVVDASGNDEVLTTLASVSLAAFTGVETLTYIGDGAFAGTGNDNANLITGGDLADTLTGNGGNDTLVGGLGNDTLKGGDGTDTVVFTGDFADYTITRKSSTEIQVVSAEGTDLLSSVEVLAFADGDRSLAEIMAKVGSTYDDTLIGGDAIDKLDGGDGNDTLVGNGGADTLLGGKGNDRVTYAADALTIDGGDGSDTLVITGAGNATINLRLADADGLGTPVVKGFENVDASAATGDMDLTGLAAAASTLLGGSGANMLTGGSAADVLSGGSGDDSINGGGGTDVISGGDGSDRIVYQATGTLDGGTGSDTLVLTGSTATTISLAQADQDGSAGAKVVGFENVDASGASAKMTLSGLAAASSTLTGGSGDDVLTGGTAADVLSGGTGADTLVGGGGADTLLGGEGADRVGYSAAAATIDGGNGTDTLSLAGQSGILIDLSLADQDDAVGGIVRNFENVDATGATGGVSIRGSAGVNVLTGGDGDDAISGAGGADTLLGGKGSDAVGLQAEGTIDGGDGNDWLVVTGSAATTVNLTLTDQDGTGGANVKGFENVQGQYATGALTLTGLAAVSSSLIGGSANDQLTGGTAADLLVGGGGNDTLKGGGGADTLLGGEGDDRIGYQTAGTMVGGNGNDWLVVNSTTAVTINLRLGDQDGTTGGVVTGFENVDATGSAGAMTLTGLAAASSSLLGGSGVNVLTGGSAADYLSGGGGDDTIVGGGGADIVLGGAGKDRITYNAAAATISGGDGSDTLVVDASGATVIDLTADDADGEGNPAVTGFENVDGSTASGALTLTGLAGATSVLTGGSGNDTITGGSAADTLTGGAGADTLMGGGGADIISGGLGSDRIGYQAAGTIDGGDGIDTLVLTGSSAVTITLSAADQDGTAGATLKNFEHVDASTATAGMTLSGIAGSTLLGGSGADRISYQTSGVMNGGGGSDWLLVKSATAVTIDLNEADQDLLAGGAVTGFENVDATGSTGVMTLTGLAAATSSLIGGSGANVLTGGSAADYLSGGDGNDTLAGNGGADVLLGGKGNDKVHYNAGAATIDGGDGVDTLVITGTSAVAINVTSTTDQDGTGGAVVKGFEHVDGRAATGDLTLTGGTGADTLTGGAGADTIKGGGGADVLRGGDGDDRIGYQTTGTLDGGADSDWLLINSATAVTINLNLDDQDGTVGGTVTGFENVDATGSAGAMTLTGLASASSSLIGGSGANVLTGGSAADYLSGGAGDDTIVGNGGGDVMLGGAGKDRITYSVHAGSTMDGGDGIDTLVVTGPVLAAAGPLQVTLDLTQGQDQDQDPFLPAVMNFENIDGSGALAELVLTGRAAATSVLTGSANADTITGGTAADTLTGGAGNDTILGGGGADTITGGAGDDRIGYGAVTGITLDGGEGSDTLAITGSSAVTINLSNADQDGTVGGLVKNFENVVAGTATGKVTLTGLASASSKLVGGSGDDLITGGSAADTLVGGSGADTLTGAAGVDTLTGGDGADTFSVTLGTGTDIITDFSKTDGDKLDLGALTGIAWVNRSTWLTQINGGADAKIQVGNDIVILKNFDSTTLELADLLGVPNTATVKVSGASIDCLAGDQTLSSTSATSVDTYTYHLSRDGNDTIVDAGGATDTLWLDGSRLKSAWDDLGTMYREGKDLVIVTYTTDETLRIKDQWSTISGATFGSGAIETIGQTDGEFGYKATVATAKDMSTSALDLILVGSDLDVDVLKGGTGDDLLFGAGNADTLYGNAGDDDIDAGAGNDSLYGGSGDDWLAGGSGNNTVDGGTQWDHAIYDTSSTAVTVTIATNGTATVTHDALFTDTVVNVEAFHGSAGNDTFHASSAKTNTGDSWSSNSWFNFMGGAGDDTFDATSDGGYILTNWDAPSGIVMNMSGSTQTWSGGTIAAYTAYDGYGGTDHFDLHVAGVYGSMHDDVIWSNTALGYSWLTGGGGNDVIYGLTSNDQVNYSDGDHGVVVNLSNSVQAYSITYTTEDATGKDVTKTVTGILAAGGLQGGTTVAKVFDGMGGVDTVYGGDSFWGSEYSDWMYGGSGADVFWGQGGNDILVGGAGADTLYGGDGADTFVITVGTGTDWVDDFTHADGDKIDLSAYSVTWATKASWLSFSNGNTVINLGGGNVVTVAGTASQTATTLVEGDFKFATQTGTAGGTVGSTASDDNLTGSTGNDTFVYQAGVDGSDTITDAGGTGDVLSIEMTAQSPLVDAIYRSGTSDADVVVHFEDGKTVTIKNGTATGLIETIKASWTDVDGLSGVTTMKVSATGTATTGSDVILGSNSAETALNGGAGDDYVAGGGGNDTVRGGDGDDFVSGGAGDDVLYGDAITPDVNASHDDMLFGNAGNDQLYGGVGSDLLVGGAGNDVLDGGEGWDDASYRFSTGPITVTLTNYNGTVTDGLGGTDTLVSIESVTGSAYGDTLSVGEANTREANFIGMAGNDTITGSDWGYQDARYDLDPNSVFASIAGVDTVVDGVTLAANTGIDGWGDVDTFSKLDGLCGSFHDDILVGNGNWGWLTGLGGNDLLVGQDTGMDIVNYDWWDGQGVKVNLGSTDYVSGAISIAANTGIDEFGDRDTFVSIEGVSGSDGADILVGSSSDNWFAGHGGGDTIIGGDGFDTVSYQPAGLESGIIANLGSDSATLGGKTVGAGEVKVGTATDHLSGIEEIVGTEFDDIIRAATSGTKITGGFGNDTLFGNDGADTFMYHTWDGNLSGTDTIYNFDSALDSLYLGGHAYADLSGLATDDGSGLSLNLTSFGLGTIHLMGVHSLQDSNILISL